MSDPSEEIKLTETNIESINRDAEKLRNVNKQITSSEANDDDVDDGLSNYTDVQEDGVSILKDTTAINRKAIFHDLNRLKKWRESVDQQRDSDDTNSNTSVSRSNSQTATVEPIMEKNIDSILDKLPDVVGGGEDKGSFDSKAVEKLYELEDKIRRSYTLDGEQG